MSTRATIILTSDNEHWHQELSAKYNYGITAPDDRCLVLEFSRQHTLHIDEVTGEFEVIVKLDSELGQALCHRLGI